TEAIGQSNAILLPTGDKYGFNLPITLLTQGDAGATYHTRRGHKDGRVLDLNLTLWAVRDRGGRVTGVAGIFREVEPAAGQRPPEPVDAIEYRLRELTRVLANLSFD